MNQQKPPYVAGALGLRALAAAWIFLLHARSYSSPDGWPIALPEPFDTVVSYGRGGTSMFFILSSFLIYAPFAAAVLAGDQLPSPRRFLRQRALRLLPPYWVILLIVSLLLGAAIVRNGEALSLGSFVDRPDLLVVNMLLLQNFWPETFITGIGPAWFVTAIAVFYLSLPLLGRLGARLAGESASFRRRVLAALAPAMVLLVVGVAVKAFSWYVLGHWAIEWNGVLVRSFLGQSDRLAFGMAASVVWMAVVVRGTRLPDKWWAVPAIGALVAGSAGFLLHRTGHIPDTALDSVWSFCLALVMLLVALSPQLPRVGRTAVRLLDAKPLIALGLVSYSIYLWHEPMIGWMRSQGLTFSGATGFAVNVASIGVVVVVLSTITYYVLERPFVSRGRRRSGQGDGPRTATIVGSAERGDLSTRPAQH